MITIFILIYLVSFALHLLIEYRENKRFIYNIGDLIDSIQIYMWVPLINTLMLILMIVVIFTMTIWELLKLDILWEKFRNIKLR